MVQLLHDGANLEQADCGADPGGILAPKMLDSVVSPMLLAGGHLGQHQNQHQLEHHQHQQRQLLHLHNTIMDGYELERPSHLPYLLASEQRQLVSPARRQASTKR